MNDKTNLIGYSQAVGLTTNSSTTLTTNCNGVINTYADRNWTNINGGTGTTIHYPNNLGLSTLITNQDNMVRQVKAAVFTVTRNEDNKVVSAKFVKEVWVEVKNGASLELSVAKYLDRDFDPSTTIIKEIYTITF
jgi:hypothetical protein